MYTMSPPLRGWPPSIGAVDVYIFDDLASYSSSEMYTIWNRWRRDPDAKMYTGGGIPE